ncbi:MAG: adenosylcobinamide amidohydrolase, partial [Thermoplasmata archaeon]
MDFYLSESDDHYAIFFNRSARKISNAPYNGGIGTASIYVNRHVGIDFDRDPVEDTRNFLKNMGYSISDAVVTLTAVDTSELVQKESSYDRFFIRTYCTVGTGNALSIGSYGQPHGTINICVLTDIPLSDSAALGIFQTVVESKSQAMNDLGIVDNATRKRAPGTSTDTV